METVERESGDGREGEWRRYFNPIKIGMPIHFCCIAVVYSHMPYYHRIIVYRYLGHWYAYGGRGSDIRKTDS